MKSFFKTSTVLALLIGASSILAEEQRGIEVSNAWIRLLPPVASATAAYMDILSAEDDELVSVSSVVAMMSELHESAMENGVMTMSHVSSLALPAGKSVSLSPGGLHIMLMNLKQPLAAGKSYPLILEFKKAGKIEIQLTTK